MLVILNFLVTRSWLPATSGEGLWFYTAAVSLILGDLIVHPYFVSPKDTLSLSIASAVAVWFIAKEPGAGSLTLTLVTLWFCLVVAAVAVLALVVGRMHGATAKAVGGIANAVSTTIGHPKTVLTAVFAVALTRFHLDDPGETALVIITWALLIGVQPERSMYWMWQRIRPNPSKITDLGGVAAYRTPGLILVHHEGPSIVELGSILICRDASGPIRLGVVLGHTGREEVPLVRCLEFSLPDDYNSWLQKTATGLGPNRVGLIDPVELPESITVHTPILGGLDRFLGIVDEKTDIRTLQFEVIEPRDIEEGHLVQLEVRGSPVVYQITNGITREDVIYKRHTHGYALATATKVGTWVPGRKQFKRAAWVPQLNSPVTLVNSPVTLVDASRDVSDEDTVGHFPGSDYPVQIGNIHHVVTHNTAVLGILGIGKSMLAIELVERMLAEGIKVVCLDLTDQYANELDAWCDRETDEASTQRIVEAGESDRGVLADNPDQGGSFPKLKEAIVSELDRFMSSEDRLLTILNPARFGATRQETEPRSYSEKGVWHRSAPLWSVSPVQVTQVVAEALLSLAQDEMRETARVCIVLEEAHSLVPEWNNVANDADRNATNGTARAILQGRKYGFGCLLITQRTANVTKTILNQCNTVFAMRTFDDTGRNFLANYLGSTHADMLPTLSEREAILFGKGSSCEDPIRVRLNDREDFLKRFRQAHPPRGRQSGSIVSDLGPEPRAVDAQSEGPPE